MEVRQRNNVRVMGEGPATLVFSHGFGCDQNAWRLLAPRYAERFRVVLFDLVGSGRSDLSAYDFDKYATLQGYADDLLEILDGVGPEPVVFVGHSVSAMIGMLADLSVPERFSAHVMVGPSPCYVRDASYDGGFSRGDIDSLLDTLESNYLGWASNMAPVIMGAPGQPELGMELTNSFCRTDPDIARQFARVTFLSDNRADLAGVAVPTLVLQCSQDVIAPDAVGRYVHEQIPGSTFAQLAATGHCPHLSAPEETTAAIRAFLSS